MQVLTLEDKILKNFAILDPLRKKVIWISGEFFKQWIPQLLAREKPRLREEIFDPKTNSQIMYLREIEEEKPEFTEALRQEFERKGIHAEYTNSNGARLQMILRNSPLSREIQDRIIYNLRRLTDPQINELLAELHSA